MAPYVRVFNETTQRHVKPAQARRWVDDGVCAWVEVGVTIRKLTVAEMAAERSRLSAEEAFRMLSLKERLAIARRQVPMAELPGLMVAGLIDIRRERSVARDGTRFAVAALAGVCR